MSKIELNQEMLESLSISDLIALEDRCWKEHEEIEEEIRKDNDWSSVRSNILLRCRDRVSLIALSCSHELQRRTDKIFITD